MMEADRYESNDIIKAFTVASQFNTELVLPLKSWQCLQMCAGGSRHGITWPSIIKNSCGERTLMEALTIMIHSSSSILY